MTKKRLSDLLRDEAQKSPSEAEEIQEAALGSLESDPTLSKTEPLYETKDETEPINMSVAPRAKRIPTKAELETTLAELKEALNEAQGKENSLQQQIADLQADLQEQKILIQKLLVELEPTNQIKAELEQAKKVILQLLEDSSKTTQKVTPPGKETEGLSLQKPALNELPHKTIQPNIPDSKISNADIGWVD